jgi:cbb3-type cytochrome c oxidase subunit III
LNGRYRARAPIYKAIAATPVEQLPANPALHAQAVEGGRAAFKVHCVQCHGAGAAGGAGYPNLNDDDWLWGGDLQSIETTLIHGIRNPEHDETRFSQMPAFGEILNKRQIAQVIAHVRSLSGLEKPNAAGAQIFAENCVACHGENGKGNRELGAPNLTDNIWLYGSDDKALRQTITYARNGVMPRWNERLSPVTIRMLAAYVHSLGGGEATPARRRPISPARRRRPKRRQMSALDLISPDSPLYQKRKGVYPKVVTGFYRRLKWLIMAVTLTIYYVTPWLRWDRGAYAPDQAVLVDLANRRFYMFAIEIWPQEFYYVAGLLIMAGIGLFLVTSAVGPRLVRLCLPTDGVDRSVVSMSNAGSTVIATPRSGWPTRRCRPPSWASAPPNMPSGWSSPLPPAARGSSISLMPRRWPGISSPARQRSSPMLPSAS